MRPIPCRLSRIFRGEVAAGADATQDDPQIGAFARRRPLCRELSNRVAKQPVRQAVELGGDHFENVREAVDNGIHQPGKYRGAGERVGLVRKVAVDKSSKRRQLGKAHRDQPLARQHKTDRRRQWLVGIGAVDHRRAQVNRAILIAQPARAFDLAQILDARHVQPGGAFDKRELVGLGVDEVDPRDIRRQARPGEVARPLAVAGAAVVKRQHRRSLSTWRFWCCTDMMD